MDIVVKAEDITKSFGKQTAVKNVSMEVKRGDIYGFIGENGAGKTTMIRMMAGLAKPTSGALSLFGNGNPVQAREKIGTVIEYPALMPGMTAKENLMVEMKLRGIKDPKKIEEVLAKVGLKDTKKKKVKNFSLGMKQRLAIAIALLGDPEFLILDEPTNGLDPVGIREIRELIKDLNQEHHITVLISSHILGELSKLATRYGIIHKGELIQEFTEEELIKRSQSNLTVKVPKEQQAEACELMKEQFGAGDCRMIGDEELKLYGFLDQPGKVNQVLMQEGIQVQEIFVETMDLEKYFLNTVGGAAC
ncbi:ABC transporter ATP-binding protein [Anaerostipes sp.]|uniref:ABC transporter ATP-binding protein n=1 Tax=Anaerostipes sp. TaxID=1872530 RepID=UPI0025B92218|nr:ABC transporter ATP-binding protein [Anaerostipes sp.]MBS7008270.1 ABC transporter ATP-binding protein [Anaerostipes sp.]